MSLTTCEICLSKKTAIKCHLCSKASCKLCVQFVDENAFELQDLLPENVRDKAFCPNCYDEHINEQLKEFLKTMELAKNVNVYEKDQGAETRFMRRIQKPIKILECDDRKETLLRLAYLAAKQGFDTIVDVELVSKKVKQGGSYKKIVWSGSAVPVAAKKPR